MTFMMPMPATASEIAAMPASATVSASITDWKVLSMAAWVISVKSSKPAWRSMSTRVTWRLTTGTSSALPACTKMRNSPV